MRTGYNYSINFSSSLTWNEPQALKLRDADHSRCNCIVLLGIQTCLGLLVLHEMEDGREDSHNGDALAQVVCLHVKMIVILGWVLLRNQWLRNRSVTTAAASVLPCCDSLWLRRERVTVSAAM